MNIELIKKPILVVDAESDGLYGDIWAIGAVVIQPSYPVAHILDTFYGAAEVRAIKDKWVAENIVPLCPETHATRRELRDKFWDFYTWHKKTCLIVADFGAPVEAHLFRLCVQDDPDKRTWEGPYPLHELATLLMLQGVDPDINREEYGVTGPKHHPGHDALCGAACWMRALMDKTYVCKEDGRMGMLEAVE